MAGDDEFEIGVVTAVYDGGWRADILVGGRKDASGAACPWGRIPCHGSPAYVGETRVVGFIAGDRQSPISLRQSAVTALSRADDSSTGGAASTWAAPTADAAATLYSGTGTLPDLVLDDDWQPDSYGTVRGMVGYTLDGVEYLAVAYAVDTDTAKVVLYRTEDGGEEATVDLEIPKPETASVTAAGVLLYNSSREELVLAMGRTATTSTSANQDTRVIRLSAADLTTLSAQTLSAVTAGRLHLGCLVAGDYLLAAVPDAMVRPDGAAMGTWTQERRVVGLRLTASGGSTSYAVAWTATLTLEAIEAFSAEPNGTRSYTYASRFVSDGLRLWVPGTGQGTASVYGPINGLRTIHTVTTVLSCHVVTLSSGAWSAYATRTSTDTDTVPDSPGQVATAAASTWQWDAGLVLGSYYSISREIAPDTTLTRRITSVTAGAVEGLYGTVAAPQWGSTAGGVSVTGPHFWSAETQVARWTMADGAQAQYDILDSAQHAVLATGTDDGTPWAILRAQDGSGELRSVDLSVPEVAATVTQTLGSAGTFAVLSGRLYYVTGGKVRRRS